MELRLEFRTGELVIDLKRCERCESFACVKACSLYGRNLFRIERGLPKPKVGGEEFARLCIECLACEIQCALHGRGAAKISLPMPSQRGD